MKRAKKQSGSVFSKGKAKKADIKTFDQLKDELLMAYKVQATQAEVDIMKLHALEEQIIKLGMFAERIPGETIH